jgi:hypothetical protein
LTARGESAYRGGGDCGFLIPEAFDVGSEVLKGTALRGADGLPSRALLTPECSKALRSKALMDFHLEHLLAPKCSEALRSEALMDFHQEHC